MNLSGFLVADPDPGPSFTAIVDSAARAAAALVGDAASWWSVPSAPLQQPAVLGAQTTLRPLLILVLTASVLIQAIRIILLRRGEPVLTTAGGLLRFAVAAALGMTLLQGALWAGDALATTLLGDSAADFGTVLRDTLTKRDGLGEPFLLLLVSVLVLVLAGAQWMAMAVRQVGLLLIATTLPLAAAGSLTTTTRAWLSRLVPWAVALVLYKPAAALVYSLGGGYLRASAPSGVGAALAGIVVLAAGVAALPALFRLVSWSSVRLAAGSTASTTIARGGGAVSLTGHARTATAVQQAAFMDTSGPGSRRQPAPGAASIRAAGVITATGPTSHPRTATAPATAPTGPGIPAPTSTPGPASTTTVAPGNPAQPGTARRSDSPPTRATASR